MQSAVCSSCCRPGIDASAVVHPLAGVGFEIVFSSGDFSFFFALCLCRRLEVKSKSGMDGPSRRGTFDRLLCFWRTTPSLSANQPHCRSSACVVPASSFLSSFALPPPALPSALLVSFLIQKKFPSWLDRGQSRTRHAGRVRGRCSSSMPGIRKALFHECRARVGDSTVGMCLRPVRMASRSGSKPGVEA